MKLSMHYLFSLLILLSLSPAQTRQSQTSWDRWQFLIGEWEASGHGSPGEGVGHFSFAPDLQNRVLVRKSHTDYPRTKDHPAFAHDDLMIVYADEAAHSFRADYYDNEGHVIRYAAEISADNQRVVFTSDRVPGQPRFRLTYLKKADGLSIKFEIAPPDKPDNFKVYVEGAAHKK